MAVGEFIEEGLRLLFLADASLAALIGTRFYDAELPPGVTVPAITLQRVSTIPEYAHSGHVGQENARFQVTIHADCHLNCMRVAAQVRRIIRDHPRGSLPGGIRYGFMQQVNEVASGRETGRNNFQIAIDFRITHQVYF
jgi:hypothetical protein